MDKEEIKRLILKEGLTITDVIDAVVELNGIIGVGLVSLGVDLKTYCVDKINKVSNTSNVRRLADLHEFLPDKRIRMIVVDEHTLAYINEGAKFANVLHASVLKGSTLRDGDLFSIDGRQVRTATRKDFEDYGVSIEGYLQKDSVFEYIIAD